MALWVCELLCKLSLCRFYAGGAENEKQPAPQSALWYVSRVREGSEKKNALTAICKGVSLVGAEGVEPPTLCL